MAAPESVVCNLEFAHDFEEWRCKARDLILARIPPDAVVWQDGGAIADDLFASVHKASGVSELINKTSERVTVRASRRFIEAARTAILHKQPERLALLYRSLWRLQARPQLMEDGADTDVFRLNQLVRNVRRDIHKMRAFVRFRTVSDPDGEERYIAWFEPEHHILRYNADFFLNRFASQKWSILTPDLSLHWDGKRLYEGPGGQRDDAQSEDYSEDLWRRYYTSIFNPARLKVAAMKREMPRKYWHNLPEADLIPELIAGAQAREAGMVMRGESLFEMPLPRTLEEVQEGISACRRCPIGCTGVRATPGEGRANARLMIVGEQPGDHEEASGRPFIGPSGALLNRHLEKAGLERSELYLTNAVKHFKFQMSGNFRKHLNPAAREIDTCRWWLDAERHIIRPQIILALGASAGRGILGRTPSVGNERGSPVRLEDGTWLVMSVHPASILRSVPVQQAEDERQFQRDVSLVANLLSAAQER